MFPDVVVIIFKKKCFQTNTGKCLITETDRYNTLQQSPTTCCNFVNINIDDIVLVVIGSSTYTNSDARALVKRLYTCKLAYSCTCTYASVSVMSSGPALAGYLARAGKRENGG